MPTTKMDDSQPYECIPNEKCFKSFLTQFLVYLHTQLFIMATESRCLLLSLGVTEKLCFELAHRSNSTR